MQDFWFYVQLGLHHVLDSSAYDHVLFLSALALPFTFKNWKKVVLLASIFTVAHCLSLVLSVYNIVSVNSNLIEFLIPLTILLTAIFNLVFERSELGKRSIAVHGLATAFFGLIHGFGFSNYFKMLVAGEENKLGPLLGFATGIEIAQVIIVLAVLAMAWLFQSKWGVKHTTFVRVGSVLIIVITIPLVYQTFPW